VWYGERRCEICYLEVRVKLSFFDLVNHNNQDRRKQDDKPFSKPLPLFWLSRTTVSSSSWVALSAATAPLGASTSWLLFIYLPALCASTHVLSLLSSPMVSVLRLFISSYWLWRTETFTMSEERTLAHIANILATHTMEEFKEAAEAMAFDDEYVLSYSSVPLCLDEMVN
jgi:hypothetical protein